MRRIACPILVVAVSFAMAAQPLPRIKQISRNFGPASGGTVLAIDGSNLKRVVECLLPCPTTVDFGGVPGILKRETPSLLWVITPEHGPGTVDITVSIAGHAPLVLEDAFTFTTNAEAGYEAVLLPIHFEGVMPGAHGSQWTTSLWIRNDGENSVLLAPWTCATEVCPAMWPLVYPLGAKQSLTRLAPLDADDGNPSRIVYVDQAGAADVSFSLRFADRSRSLTDAGIDLPVIRESETIYDTAHLFSVPLGSTFRVMLRLYELGEVETARYRIALYAQSEADTAAVHTEELTITRPAGAFAPQAGYAQFDVTALLRFEKLWPETARIEITPLTEGSRFWSFASITNNDTQIVTLVTPQ